ncbi:ribonuclease H-like domain-containing protein [Salinarchaeum laminariae]|uniref:ribonuclease H-like domain-containing protein n=1 Tax=Salinarchaeum laminariae TaxID=869888 RepID=UPI0020C16E32|nr:ribonuclease H-like domain-containing protein [Salinarchaeum laminariae]
MRFFAFSDWRTQSIDTLFELIDGLEEPVDFIIYAGDDVGRFEDDDRNVFAELAQQTRRGKLLAVIGNDDLEYIRDVLDAPGVIDLHRESIFTNNYVFLGQEGAVEGGPGYVLYSEPEIRQNLSNQYDGHEEKIPILVSHTPPDGVLDIARRFGQRHIGSTGVREFVEQESPALTVCGHCHQFGGRSETIDGSTVINVASHDHDGAKGRYAIIELENPGIEYRLETTDSGIDHDLLTLSQVGSRRIRQFEEADITALAEITEEAREALLTLPGVYEWHVDMWIKEARAIQEDEFRVTDPAEFAFLQDDAVLIDIETDLEQQHIWLIGIYNLSSGEFHQIFEPDDEVALLEAFIQHLSRLDTPPVIYYGNNRFDEDCLRQRLTAHGFESETHLLAESYDLGIRVHNHLLGDFNGTSLDVIAKRIADFEYEYPDIDGFIVGHRFTKYLLDGTEPEWEDLRGYNRDDVLAMRAVVRELRELIDTAE